MKTSSSRTIFLFWKLRNFNVNLREGHNAHLKEGVMEDCSQSLEDHEANEKAENEWKQQQIQEAVAKFLIRFPDGKPPPLE